MELTKAEEQMLLAVPMTQVRTASKISWETSRGRVFAPTGIEYKRAHALERRGLAESLHGRKGEGIEHFKLTYLGGRLLMLRRFDLAA